MNAEITIFDKGRGPQLSTSRITVQDLVPYFQLNYSYDEIRRVMPTLSVAEIQAVERYVDEHREEVMDEDRRIRERNATRRNPADVEDVFRRTREKWPALKAAYENITARKPTVTGVLADVNIQGHVDLLMELVRSDEWIRQYAGRVVVSLIQTLLDLDAVRGAGRLYLP